jgi:hypothetical protein
MGAEFHVALTGAFLTGHPLRVRIGEYNQLRSDLMRELQRLDGQGWSVDTENWRQDGTYTYDSGGGFASMLPLVLARRDGPAMLARAQAALRNQPDAEHAWLGEQTQGWNLTPRTFRIDVYDLGMAVMNGTFAVCSPAGLSLQAAARTLKRLAWLKPDPDSGVRSPIAGAFRELADETAQQVATAIAHGAPHTVQEAWLSPFLDAQAVDEKTQTPRPDHWGRLLWLHPVHLLEVSDTNDGLTASAAQLAPPFHRSIGIQDGLFVPGIGWSAIVTYAGAPGAEIPLRLTELHWAYIALYMEIDRGLLALLDDDRWYEPESLAELEQDADRVFGDYMRIMEARARLDSALVSLGGDELAIWKVIADVQEFDALVDGVDRKVEVLQRVAERRVQQAAASRAQRTSRILSGLTALTLVTVAIALIGNFLGNRSDALGHIELRVVIVAIALVAALAVYRKAYSERTRRRDKIRLRHRPPDRPELEQATKCQVNEPGEQR